MYLPGTPFRTRFVRVPNGVSPNRFLGTGATKTKDDNNSKGETTVNIKTILKTSVAAAALVAFAAPTMAQSNFETGQPKVKLKLYGQVDKAYMHADDGNNGRGFIGDNKASSTRIGFLATAPVNADMNFGALIETEWLQNGTGTVTVGSNNYSNALTTNDRGTGATTWSIRHADTFIDHKRFGKLSLGQGSAAADTALEATKQGAGLVTGVAGALTGTGIKIWDNDASKIHTGTNVGSVISYGTVQSTREDRVRYDTPVFMGAKLAVSSGTGGTGDIGATYANKFGAFDVDGRIGYRSVSGIDTTYEDMIGGSLAVGHTSGLNASFAMGKVAFKATGRDSSTFVGGQLGYTAKIFGVGPTGFSADYYQQKDLNANNWKGESWGLGAQQSFADIGSDVFIGYRNFSFSAPATAGVDPDDVNLVIAGIRVAF